MNKLTQSEKEKMFSLFLDMKNERKDNSQVSPSTEKNRNSDVLIVDGNNTFMRCWAAIPSMNEDGVHTGGVAGFLKSIGYAIRLLNSTRCVIVFDGKGGSKRRKAIYPDYKEHKSPGIRLNRIYEEISELQDEEKNLKLQFVRTIQYLESLPVSIISIDNVEADDTIAYCATSYFKDKCSIMSSDKDFLQLINDRITVWSPTKKRLYGPAEVLGDYQIHPNNFVLFRALDGDPSDNVSGIKGFGAKTCIKCFPMLSEPRVVDKTELYTHAEANKDKYKVYCTFLENRDIFERNIQLMQLSETYVPTYSQLNINDSLNAEGRKMSRASFTRLITEDKMWTNISNHQTWLTETFSVIDRLA